MVRKLKCFIACAFGRNDVDNIFTKGILPILKELNIKPMRVDKINHNKNIDQKILDLIEECDFGIADLTYARPSVYYEAGFIHGLAKEVIFTIRKDHLSPDKNDIEGNRRIHFDLSTKNIIDWQNPSNIFKQRLKQRINLIKNPILEKINRDQKIKEKEIIFSSQSLKDRKKIVLDLSKRIIKKNNYKLVQPIESIFPINGQKGIGKNLQTIGIAAYESITIKILGNLEFWIGMDFLSRYAKRQNIVLISLKSVNVESIHKIFPTLYKDPTKKDFKTKYREGEKQIRLIVMDNIKSEEDLLNRINSVKI